MSKLMVGAGKSSLNPTPDMFPIPTSAKDWGTPVAPQGAIYDDMDCRAIAVDNGTKRVMFIAFDLGGLPGVENLAEKIADAIGWSVDELFMSATHNHTGPHDAPMGPGRGNTPEEMAFYEKYQVLELNAAIDAAKKAIATMRPAKYGFGETLSYVNTNRDLQTPFGFWCEARNLAGYSDKTLACLKFVEPDGTPIAALMNHATHATCCYILKDADGVRKTSGNFTGIASRFAEEHFGNDFVCIWTSGAAGNQNPLLSHGMQYEYPDGYTTAVNYPDGVGYMQMEFMGRWHGADIVKGIDAVTTYTDKMPIKYLRDSVDLPSQKKAVNPKDPKASAFRMGGNGLRTDNTPPQLPTVPDRVPDDGPVNLKMKLLLLGDVAILGAAAELYCEIGRDMKAASPYRKTFVVTHTEQRKDAAGYILDKTSKDKLVFQAFSKVVPGSSDELILECEAKLFDAALAE